MVALLVLAGAVVLMIPLCIWSGFVLATMWGWFIVPFGMPPLAIAHAVGLTLLIAWARAPKMDRSKEVELPFRDIGVGFLASLFVLGAGWVAKSFM